MATSCRSNFAILLRRFKPTARLPIIAGISARGNKGVLGRSGEEEDEEEEEEGRREISCSHDKLDVSDFRFAVVNVTSPVAISRAGTSAGRYMPADLFTNF
ncbi:hypothetical protein KM043_005541 [Ampulex compressa]|nr:hypothetical protein KM043_005541 [Ampulex compressa]